MARKLSIFALFYFVFEGKFQVQAPGRAYIRRGDLTEGFSRYDFGGLIHGGAYFRNFTVLQIFPYTHYSLYKGPILSPNHKPFSQLPHCCWCFYPKQYSVPFFGSYLWAHCEPLVWVVYQMLYENRMFFEDQLMMFLRARQPNLQSRPWQIVVA